MKHDNLSDFFQWVFAFLVMIAGAALTAETAPGGFLVILAGALILPSFSEWTNQNLKVRFPLFVRVLFFIAFLLAGTWFSGARMQNDLKFEELPRIQTYR